MGVIFARLRRIEPLLPVVATGFAIVWCLHRLDDWDTWWHLAAGRWIAEHRSVPLTDTLSYTVPDHPWVNLQWLFDLGLYGLYRAGGADLLVYVAALMFGLAVALLIVNLRSSLGPVGASAVALWVTCIMAERSQIRPEMVSFVLLQTVLWLLVTARRDEGRRLWFLPPVILLWVNNHSLFIVGLLAIGCAMAGAVTAGWLPLPEAWRRASSWEPRARKRLLLAGTASFLVTVLNPFLLEGALFPFKLLSRIDGRSAAFQTVGEFVPPFTPYAPTLALRAYQGFFVLAVAAVALAGGVSAMAGLKRPRTAPNQKGARKRGSDGIPSAPSTDLAEGAREGVERFDLAGLAFFAGLAYLSLLARRNIVLFAMGTAPFLGQCLLVLKTKLQARLPREGRFTSLGAAVLLPVVAVATWFVTSNGLYRWNDETREFGAGLQEENFPIRATAFVREMKLPPRLYSDMAAGAYLAWERPLDEGDYIDGRLEVYDTDFFTAYVAHLANPDLWLEEADRLGIRTAMVFHRWPNHEALIRRLNTDPRWALVYVDEVAVIFVRQAGNERLIQQARERSAPIFLERAQSLMQPVSSWQWPVGRMVAVTNFAETLVMLGNMEWALRLYSSSVNLGLIPRLEGMIRLFLAEQYHRRGDTALARMHLELAARADPGNPSLPRLQSIIGR